MMRVAFEAPTWLVICLVIPMAWTIARRRPASAHATPWRRSLQVHLAVLALLSLALARPALVSVPEGTAVAYLVDVSTSQDMAARREALRRFRAVTPTSAARVVLFAGRARSIDASVVEETLAQPGSNVIASLEVEDTNIESAVEEAIANLPRNQAKRLVLISDGRETAGRVLDALPLARHARVQIDTVPVEPSPADDVWIDPPIVPDSVAVAEPFEVKVSIHGVAPVAQIELWSEGERLASTRVALTDDASSIRMAAQLPSAGLHVLECRVLVAGDAVSANNVTRAAVVVRSPIRVLVVEGRPQAARFLRNALTRARFTVDVIGPARLPAVSGAFARYDAVVLSDVGRDALSQPQMTTLTRYVEDDGGGLVLAGGDSFYRPESYADSEIESLMPVTFEHERSVSLVVVLDRSWSMDSPITGPDLATSDHPSKMKLALAATRAAIEALPAHHRVGVLTFSAGFEWAIPLQRATDKASLVQRVNRIVSGGGTRIFAALEEVDRSLADVPTRTKHVLLLSDGHADPGERKTVADYKRLVDRLAAAGVTISTVAVGDAADRTLLADIARWTGGRSYSMENGNEIPSVFVRETEEAVRPLVVEKGVRVVGKVATPIAEGLDLRSAPVLRGYARTKARPDADVVIESPERDPILAVWRRGLGVAVVFTSDLTDRWGSAWTEWSGYGRLWSQVMRFAARRPPTSASLSFERHGMTRMMLDLVRPDGSFANLTAPLLDVAAPGGPSARIEARQVGPGLYEALLPLRGDADYTVGIVNGEGTLPIGALLASYPPELRREPADRDLLQALSRATGGRFEPPALDQGDPQVASQPFRRELWPWFALLALLGHLGALWLRRVRVVPRGAISGGLPPRRLEA